MWTSTLARRSRERYSGLKAVTWYGSRVWLVESGTFSVQGSGEWECCWTQCWEVQWEREPCRCLPRQWCTVMSGSPIDLIPSAMTVLGHTITFVVVVRCQPVSAQRCLDDTLTAWSLVARRPHLRISWAFSHATAGLLDVRPKKPGNHVHWSYQSPRSGDKSLLFCFIARLFEICMDCVEWMNIVLGKKWIN